MPDQFLLIARPWVGFNRDFPFFEKYKTSLEENLGPKIEADVLVWAKKNKPQVAKAKKHNVETMRMQIAWCEGNSSPRPLPSGPPATKDKKRRDQQFLSTRPRMD